MPIQLSDKVKKKLGNSESEGSQTTINWLSNADPDTRVPSPQSFLNMGRGKKPFSVTGFALTLPLKDENDEFLPLDILKKRADQVLQDLKTIDGLQAMSVGFSHISVKGKVGAIVKAIEHSGVQCAIADGAEMLRGAAAGGHG